MKERKLSGEWRGRGGDRLGGVDTVTVGCWRVTVAGGRWGKFEVVYESLLAIVARLSEMVQGKSNEQMELLLYALERRVVPCDQTDMRLSSSLSPQSGRRCRAKRRVSRHMADCASLSDARLCVDDTIESA